MPPSDFELVLDRELSVLRQRLLEAHDGGARGQAERLPSTKLSSCLCIQDNFSQLQLHPGEAPVTSQHGLAGMISTASLTSPRNSGLVFPDRLSRSTVSWDVRGHGSEVGAQGDEVGLQDSGTLLAAPSKVDSKGLDSRAEYHWKRLINFIIGIHMFQEAYGGFAVHKRWQLRNNNAVPEVMRMHSGEFESLPSFLNLSNTQDASGRFPTIHPNSMFRFAWLLVIIAACMFEFLILPVELAHHIGTDGKWAIIQTVGAVIWTLDIGLNFFTAIYVNGRLRQDLKTIAVQYIGTWFWIDLTVVVFEWLFFFQIFDGNVAVILRVMRMVRLTKLMRLRRINLFLSDVLLNEMDTVVGYLSATLLCVVYAGAIHVTSCIFYWIRFRIIGRIEDVEVFYRIDAKDTAANYLLSLQWTISLLCWSDVDPMGTVADSIVVSVFRFAGLIATGVFLSKMLFIMQRLKDKTKEELLCAIDVFFKTHSISDDLSVQVSDWASVYHSKAWLQNRIDKEALLLDMLPVKMKVDLREEVCTAFSCDISFLSQLHDQFRGCFRHVCMDAMKEMVISKHSHVFERAAKSFKYYVINSGHCSYHIRKSVTEGLSSGTALCEMTLWTYWKHTGSLCVTRSGVIVTMDATAFGHVVQADMEASAMANAFARKVLADVDKQIPSDLTCLSADFGELDGWMSPFFFQTSDHLAFLSHYKEEAGTEAALLRDALLDKIKLDPELQAGNSKMDNPIFLDSEDIDDLTGLEDQIKRSHNFVMLLTPKLLTRPWCLAEIVFAVRSAVHIVPVEIQKAGMARFTYPDDAFYDKLRSGELLSTDAKRLLQAYDIDLQELERCLKEVFLKIALTFSPHKSTIIRSAETLRIVHRFKAKPRRPSSMARWR